MRGIIMFFLMVIAGMAFPHEEGDTRQEQLHQQRESIIHSFFQLAGIREAPVERYFAPEGIIIQRPVYGELQLVIRPAELPEPLSGYTAIAVQSFDNKEDYAKAESDLSAGSFDFEQLLVSHQLTLAAKPPISDKDPQNRLYRVALTEGGALLKKGEEQKEFGYLIAFYNEHKKAAGYVLDKLPLLTAKHSSSPLIVALMYHHFSDKPEELSSVTVHPDTFRKQLQALREEGFQSIRQQDLLAYLEGGPDAMLPEKSVLITIDDGYESNYKLAYPILAEEQFYAAIFVVTSYVGETPFYSRHFSWDEGLDMYHSGYIDIQSHTYNSHYYGETRTITRPALTHRLLLDGQDMLETKAQYDARIYEDLSLSRKLIEEHIGNSVISLTYPYGASNDSVISIASSLDHHLMYTVKEGIIRRNSSRSLLPRINAHGKYTAEQLISRIYKYAGG